MDFKIGQLVEIVDAPDQPRWIRDYTGYTALRDYTGYTALIVDISVIHTTYKYKRYKVLIEDKVYEVHPLDIKPLYDEDP